jgi:hypothetical protein
MLKMLILIVPLLAVGCIPEDFQSTVPSAGVDVTPAKGGGGTIEPAEIPINVRVTVERQQSPVIINERDEFAETCDCGCGESGCSCKESLYSSTPDVPEKRFGNNGSACRTWTQGGNLYWMADGVQWYLETGGTLGEGQAVQGGRFVMINGQIIDTSRGRVESRDTSPQYSKQCDDTGCRLIRGN